MSITIREVPRALLDELAARAARSGRYLQAYLNDLLVSSVAKPAPSDVVARARARVAATGTLVSAEAISRPVTTNAGDLDRGLRCLSAGRPPR